MKSIKYFTQLIVACFVMILGLLISTNSVYASSNKPTLDKQTVYCFVAPKNVSKYPISLPAGAKVTKITSSNKSVISIKEETPYNYQYGKYFDSYTVKKAGKTTITYTIQYQNKKYVLKQKFICKGDCPFTKLTVNGKNRLKDATSGTHNIVSKSSKNEIKWSISKNYKFDKSNIFNANKSGCTLYYSTYTSCHMVYMYFKDKQGHKYEPYLIYVSQKPLK